MLFITFLQQNHQPFFSTLPKNVLEVLAAENFVQIHKSYIVNKSYLKSYNLTAVELTNGKQLNVGRKYKNQFKKYFEKKA